MAGEFLLVEALGEEILLPGSDFQVPRNIWSNAVDKRSWPFLTESLTTAVPNMDILQIVALEVPEFQSEVVLAGN